MCGSVINNPLSVIFNCGNICRKKNDNIWRFHSMAIPGFHELFESRIKNYFSCTVRLVRGYVSKNYFIPP